MKKNIFKYAALSAIALIGFAACEKKDNVKKSLTEDEVKNVLKIMTISERLAYDKSVNLKTNYLRSNNDDVSTVPDDTGITTENPINIIILEFDGLGRLAKGNGSNKCGGFGLCDVVWFPNRGYEVTTGSILEYDEEGKEFYFDVLLSEKAPDDITKESFNFHIDEDIFIDTKEVTGKSLSVQQGVYKLNDKLGSAGGYRISVKEE